MAKYRSSSGYRGVHPFLGTVIHVKGWKASMGGLWVIKKDLMKAGQAYTVRLSRDHSRTSLLRPPTSQCRKVAAEVALELGCLFHSGFYDLGHLHTSLWALNLCMLVPMHTHLCIIPCSTSTNRHANAYVSYPAQQVQINMQMVNIYIYIF